ncbi:hypothetical protein LXA43DRAFT_660123 [Ganoderma leucocontextum]|nr:hypothetical protein LXA43DRAFT_660123 [Ganoderma leucocontextum]
MLGLVDYRRRRAVRVFVCTLWFDAGAQPPFTVGHDTWHMLVAGAPMSNSRAVEAQLRYFLGSSEHDGGNCPVTRTG